MNFKAATDSLCEKLDHDDVAAALGVSVQAIRQARMDEGANAHRPPPKDWHSAVIRMAEDRVWHYRRLIEALRNEKGDCNV
jgi:hypothetical protein